MQIYQCWLDQVIECVKKWWINFLEINWSICTLLPSDYLVQIIFDCNNKNELLVIGYNNHWNKLQAGERHIQKINRNFDWNEYILIVHRWWWAAGIWTDAIVIDIWWLQITIRIQRGQVCIRSREFIWKRLSLHKCFRESNRRILTQHMLQ